MPEQLAPGKLTVMKISRISAQRGVTLLEVLVALVIFAFGLLAAAGLQLSSLQAAQYSANSGVATSMAREYGELMQMVPSGVKATFNAESTTTNSLLFDSKTLDISSPDANACVGTGASCNTNTSAGMIKFVNSMRNDWVKRVQSTQMLPAGRAEVCRDSSPRNASGHLEWGGCDEAGEMVMVKMGWLGKPMAGTTDTPPDWMTADRPRFGVSVMANLRDYVAN